MAKPEKDEKKELFPSLMQSLDDFLYEEEGNITRNKVVAMGTMVLILSLLMADELVNYTDEILDIYGKDRENVNQEI